MNEPESGGAAAPEGAPQPLAGIRVLDCGQFIAGPLCAAMLADLGADVIRVERPKGGADREVQPLGEGHPGGAVYGHVNRNKRSLALDLFDAASRPVLDALAARTDIVVVNAPPATREAMGLDYERLASINPGIILVTCTAFGAPTGLSHLPGFDGVGQAVSGAMHLSGEAGEPRKSYVHFVDHMTAALSAFAAMAALRERDATGRGRHIEASLAGSALFMMAGNLIEESVLGPGRQGTGNRAQLAAPANTYATRDGHLLVQAIGAGIFRRAARLLGREDWLADPRYADDEARGANFDELDAAMSAWCAARTTDECLGELRAALIPVAPVLSPRQALEDPALAREHVWQGGHALAQPIAYSGHVAPVDRAAPHLGQHSFEILAEAGIDRASIAALLDGGVLAGRDAEPD